jgi:hypothetical protein
MIQELLSYSFRENGDGTHIACVTYGTRAQRQFAFNEDDVNTEKKALKKIDQIQYTRTYTLKYATYTTTARSNHAQLSPGLARVLLLHEHSINTLLFIQEVPQQQDLP